MSAAEYALRLANGEPLESVLDEVRRFVVDSQGVVTIESAGAEAEK